MSKDVKLQALRTACEVEEQQALERKKKVDLVVAERKQIVDVLFVKHDALLSRLKKLTTTDRAEALHAGDAQALAAVTRFEKRLNGDLEKLLVDLELRTKELEKAQERVQLADKELVEARIEKKKIEKFLENWKQSERVKDAAIDEAITDEMSSYKRTK
jgi:hypothetical protein